MVRIKLSRKIPIKILVPKLGQHEQPIKRVAPAKLRIIWQPIRKRTHQEANGKAQEAPREFRGC